MSDASKISGFTPGPYFIDPKHPDCIYVQRREGVRGIIGHTLMKLERGSDEWINTAKLLAAAPDMHAEIASLRAELDGMRTAFAAERQVSLTFADELGKAAYQSRAAARRDAETIARLRERLTVIADWDKAPITGEWRESLLDIIRSICDCARAALRSATETKDEST